MARRRAREHSAKSKVCSNDVKRFLKKAKISAHFSNDKMIWRCGSVS